MLQTNVQITAGTNRTIAEFQNLIEQRIQWCNETKEDAVAAIAITALRSIRAATRVADDTKPPPVEVAVCGELKLSYDGRTKKPCLRNAGGVKYTFAKGEKLLIEDLTRNVQVFKATDEWKGRTTTYYIVAATPERAEWALQRRIAARMRAMKGLARKALSVLMSKTCTIKDSYQTNQDVTKMAGEVTRKSELKNGEHYRLDLSDMLDYATLAVEGGDGIVDASLKKAANKAASVINQKCKGILNFEKLETPFPEVSRRRG